MCTNDSMQILYSPEGGDRGQLKLYDSWNIKDHFKQYQKLITSTCIHT